MRSVIIDKIYEHKLVAIVRGVVPKDCVKIAKALYDGGFRLMEITFDNKDPETFQQTADAIHAVKEAFDEKMFVGAGTVLTPMQVEMVANAGGAFIISPDVNPEVIQKTVDLGMVSMPGALTPSEITAAYRAGADFVKLFPITTLGTSYVKAIRAPLKHIPMLAVGGVTPENLPEFLKFGCVGAGIGGNLVNHEAVKSGDFEAITKIALSFTNAIMGK